MTLKTTNTLVTVAKVILLPVCLLFFQEGCQTETKIPATASKPIPVVTNDIFAGDVVESSPTASFDEETAQMLKRHSFPSNTPSEGTTVKIMDDTRFPRPVDSRVTFDEENSIPPEDSAEQPREKDAAVFVETEVAGEPSNSLQDIIPSADPVFEDVTLKLPALCDPNLADKMISVNFDQAQIGFVIKTISDITGINFIVDEGISGTVTVLSPTQIRLGDLYHFLESILEVKGFAAVPTADHVKIVPRENALKRNLNIRVGSDPAQIPQNDAVVTQIMPLKYADAFEVSNILAERMPAETKSAVYSRTNTIVVTSTSANIHHIARIIQQLDVPGAMEMFTVIPLKYASAQALSRHLTEIMENKSDSARSRRPAPPGRSQSNIQIQPDQRINALIVTANRQDTEIIEQLVKRLDIERPAGTDDVQVVYLKNAQAEEVAKALSEALVNLRGLDDKGAQPQVHITPEKGTNSLIINATPQDYQVIAAIIDKLDIIREQVLVELLIIEVSEDNLREIGVDWATLDQAVSDSIRFFGRTNFGIRVDSASGNLEGLSVGAFKEVAGGVQIGSILSALEKVSAVNILSTPHIVTSNHRQALILVGDNIPFVTKSRITETDPSTPTVIRTIDYKDVGVNMKITPHISQGGLIRLEIESEFTQLIESVTGLTPETPTTAKRQVTTEISMADGATIIIGGLIRDDKITLENKIPLLGDIPLVGGLFRLKRDRLQKTNLLIFITPHVMSGAEDMAKITKKKQDEIAPELGRQVREKNINNVDLLESIWR